MAQSPLQAALNAVKSDASLETMNKLVRNCAQNPTEEKYRKVRHHIFFVDPPKWRSAPNCGGEMQGEPVFILAVQVTQSNHVQGKRSSEEE